VSSAKAAKYMHCYLKQKEKENIQSGMINAASDGPLQSSIGFLIEKMKPKWCGYLN
jgi:hypothetical protein